MDILLSGVAFVAVTLLASALDDKKLREEKDKVITKFYGLA